MRPVSVVTARAHDAEEPGCTGHPSAARGRHGRPEQAGHAGIGPDSSIPFSSATACTSSIAGVPFAARAAAARVKPGAGSVHAERDRGLGELVADRVRGVPRRRHRLPGTRGAPRRRADGQHAGRPREHDGAGHGRAGRAPRGADLRRATPARPPLTDRSRRTRPLRRPSRTPRPSTSSGRRSTTGSAVLRPVRSRARPVGGVCRATRPAIVGSPRGASAARRATWPRCRDW